MEDITCIRFFTDWDEYRQAYKGQGSKLGLLAPV